MTAEALSRITRNVLIGFFKWSKPIAKEDSSKRAFVAPDYRKLRNSRKNYLQDLSHQKCFWSNLRSGMTS
jgi:hypothetical protein